MQQIWEHSQGTYSPPATSSFRLQARLVQSVPSPCTLEVREQRRPAMGSACFHVEGEEVKGANGFTDIRMLGEAGRQGTLGPVLV